MMYIDVYIYIYIYTHTVLCIGMCIYIYIYREREGENDMRRWRTTSSRGVAQRGFIGWANNHFNNLHLINSLETKNNT